MKNRKAWTITYWIVTTLLSAFILIGAVVDVLQVPEAVALMTELQYPAYLLLIVGWGKILGIIGIWQRWWPFLREWAYAGLVIDLLGAFISHMFVGHGPDVYSGSLIGLFLTLLSYVAYRKVTPKAA